MKSSADSLLHLINDILDFSKIEAGKLELEETEFEIRDLFSDTLKTLAVRADKKHLELVRFACRPTCRGAWSEIQRACGN